MPTERLRLALRLNAATSLIGGLLALVAGSWVSRELGIDHVVATRVIGAGLVVFAVDVASIARAPRPRLLRDTLLVSAADVAWVIATIVVLLTGILSTTGVRVAVVLGLGVADFAVVQLWLQSAAVSADRAAPGVTRRIRPASASDR